MATKETKTQSVYEVLSAVNVSHMTEKKNGLTYLSWAHAWGELLKHYPNSVYTVYESEGGLNYFTDGKTCWVKTGVTVEGKELIEYLPVMDFRNQSISVDKVTSFDVNKTIQRSLTKAIARHGLGLNVYAGEDLPLAEKSDSDKTPKTPVKPSDKEWLNKGTENFDKVVSALKAKKATISQVLTKYRLSSEVKKELESLVGA